MWKRSLGCVHSLLTYCLIHCNWRRDATSDDLSSETPGVTVNLPVLCVCLFLFLFFFKFPSSTNHTSRNNLPHFIKLRNLFLCIDSQIIEHFKILVNLNNLKYLKYLPVLFLIRVFVLLALFYKVMWGSNLNSEVFLKLLPQFIYS